jgi:nucleoside-diphosphate-sugar epimerase
MSDTRKRTVVVAGASGIVGRAALERFAGREGWEAIGLSRRKPVAMPAGAQHLPLDLLDREASARALGALRDVGYLIFAALNERDDDLRAGWRDPEQIAKNEAMFVNTLDPLARSGALRHVGVVHGGKAYGVHIPGEKLPIPLYEDHPRHPADNFYHRQEDYVRKLQPGSAWSWTILRACHTYGIAVGGNMDAFLVLVVFAALCKEAGRELPVPDGRSAICEPTDAELIAEALEWAMQAPTARNEIFNINNGDLCADYDIFPIVARSLGVKLGAPRRFDFNTEFDQLAHLWPAMVEKYDLRVPADLDEMLGNSRQVADKWSKDWPPENLLRAGVEATIKIRQAGFHSCMDSRVMLAKYVRRMQELKMVP